MRFPAVFGVADAHMRYLYEGSAVEVIAWLKEHPYVKEPRIIDDKGFYDLDQRAVPRQYGSQ